MAGNKTRRDVKIGLLQDEDYSDIFSSYSKANDLNGITAQEFLNMDADISKD